MRSAPLLLLLAACAPDAVPVASPLPVTLEEGVTRAGSLRLRTMGIGRNQVTELAAVAPRVEPCAGPACLEGGAYVYDTVVEWWAPHPRGVEQGWTLAAAPPGSGPIRVVVGVSGAVEPAGDAVVILAAGERWRYDSLSAWDADLRPLPAGFRIFQSRIEIVVDDEGARYPIQIDPVLSSASVLAWTGSAGLASGMNLLGDVDVNADGFSDVLSGAPEPYADTAAPVAGELLYYQGSGSGIDTTVAQALTGASAGDRFGAVMCAGDFDGDGDDDVAVGAPGASLGLGAVYVFGASSGGLAAVPSQVITGGLGSFGTYVVCPGDVNNDGNDDLVVYGDAVNSVFLGSSSGLGTPASQTLPFYVPRAAGDYDNDGYDDVLIGLEVYLGNAGGVSTTAVTTAGASADAAAMGNYDGDPYADLAVGVTAGRGAVSVFSGSSTGLTLANSYAGTTAGEAFGGALAWADVNGDAYDDLMIGSRNADDSAADAGLVEVYLGGSGGLSTTVYQTILPTALGACEGFGAALAAAGDVNDDGFEDLVVGTGVGSPTTACSSSAQSGSIYVIYGEEDADQDTVAANVDCDDLDPSVGEAATWYNDLDGDGHGAGDGIAACIQPGGTAANADDCDDSAASTYPGAVEVCNFADDNCDASVDELVPPATWYADADGDTQGDPNLSTLACDVPEGYVGTASDCDDSNPDIRAGATETPGNGIDEDCDGNESCFHDIDADGFGSGPSFPSASLTCSLYQMSPFDTDCNDGASSIYPGTAEVCDDVDNDCDGSVDEAGAAGERTFYIDADADGFGSEINTLRSCATVPGYSGVSGDCDDANIAVSPSATEVVGDAADNDCDGYESCYQDFDGDSFGSTSTTSSTDLDCTDYPETPTGGDCNDALSTAHPGATEVCNRVDDNCDTMVDEAGAVGEAEFYADTDDDGYGDESSSLVMCWETDGYVDVVGDCDDADAEYHPFASESDCTDPNDYNCDGTVGYADGDGDTFAACLDCDDGAAAVNPDAQEVCDGLDNNCDSNTDDFTAADASVYYLDADQDGYGNAGRSVNACGPPSGYTEDATDCDDTNPSANPASTVEECSTPGDLNCDGVENYVDADQDGYAACDECDDSVRYTHPGATETCDGMDNNCDGAVDELDLDGDGESDCVEEVPDTGVEKDKPDDPGEDPDCGCQQDGGAASLGLLLGAALLIRRRRRG